MNSLDYAAELVAPYEPQVPITELVGQLNRFFHASEARTYDTRHGAVLTQVVPIWREMFSVGLAGLEPRPLRVLDFGCGTGFEAVCLLESVHNIRVGQLVCFDVSPEMLTVCRDRLAAFPHPIAYLSDPAGLFEGGGTFDVLLTNSLLHHLPDIPTTMRRLRALTAESAVWLAGHEPSNRFWANPECRRVLARFQRQWRYRKYLSPRKYTRYASRLLGKEIHPAKDAAMVAANLGLLRREPPADVVALLVDCHVAHSEYEVERGRGFNVEELANDLAGTWQLEWRRTYSFMGTFFEGDLPARWQRRCRDLERQFPNDGSFFCAVWRRE